MLNQEDERVAKAQLVMLDILKVIHELCEKHQIQYTLIAGTLLGAVRHKGFIPWDDDCDIAMLRKDYERFLAIAEKELPKGYFLQTKKTDPKFFLNFAKIRKDGTKIIEFRETGNEEYHHGIYVDIFPFDYYKYEWFIDWMHWTQTVRDRRLKYRKGSIKRSLVTIYTNIILLIPVQVSLMFKRYFEKHKEYFSNPEYEYASYGLECCPVFKIKKDDLIPTRIVEKAFEGFDFYCANNPDGVLRGNFNDKYMELPPVNQRKTHAKYIEC